MTWTRSCGDVVTTVKFLNHDPVVVSHFGIPFDQSNLADILSFKEIFVR